MTMPEQNSRGPGVSEETTPNRHLLDVDKVETTDSYASQATLKRIYVSGAIFAWCSLPPEHGPLD